MPGASISNFCRILNIHLNVFDIKIKQL